MFLLETNEQVNSGSCQNRPLFVFESHFVQLKFVLVFNPNKRGGKGYFCLLKMATGGKEERNPLKNCGVFVVAFLWQVSLLVDQFFHRQINAKEPLCVSYFVLFY